MSLISSSSLSSSSSNRLHTASPLGAALCRLATHAGESTANALLSARSRFRSFSLSRTLVARSLSYSALAAASSAFSLLMRASNSST